ncbi:MAG: hypothetical protein JXK07_09295 [Spirochaetes bacterium]|nr:hypothetical protein [Spirochaetota bacterium]MBN2771526.1 hypothetical protein [Spirochaetota bacterium]
MASKQEKFSAGGLISLQGKNQGCFCSLMSGRVEMLSAPSDYSGLDQSLVLKHSVRVGIFESKNHFFILPGSTYRAVTDCVIQKSNMTPQSFSAVAASDPGTAITALSYQFANTESTYKEMVRVSKVKKNLEQISDNVMILFRELSPRDVSGELQSHIDNLYTKMSQSEAQLPAEITSSVLMNDNSRFLQKNYQEGSLEFGSFCDKSHYDFYKRFLKLNTNVLAHLVKGDPAIPGFMFAKVFDIYCKLGSRLMSMQLEIEKHMKLLFASDSSISSTLIHEGAINDFIASGRLGRTFLTDFVSLVQKIYSMYKDVSGRDASALFPGLAEISGFVATNRQPGATPAQGSGDSAVSFSEGSSQVLSLYNNSLQQIFEFAVAEAEFKKEFLHHLNHFKKIENPFSPDSDARKVRRHLTRMYWQLYNKVYIRSKRSKSVPAPAKLMLLYGFIDENLAEPQQIPVLHRLALDRYKPTAPIMYEYEFLSRIYAGKETPSVSEMGLTFEKQLREMAKGTRKGKNPMEYLDDPIYKTQYEIDNMLQSTTSVCSGSRSTAFPIFTEKLLRGDPQSFVVTKSKLDAIFKELVDYDYSCFYRETVYKGADTRDVIEEEVYPYIILVPTFGTKTMMWQEIVDINKRSRARIVVPVHFIGDLKTELAHAFAIYRWELNRTLKGGLWADPVEGGITGAYSDYIQFYKKNKKLSDEARKKIAEKIRSVRGNTREIFAEDYIMWLTYEKDGVMKLNPVVRDMFYRYIPFKNEIREKLERMPAFQDSAIRFKNIRNRTFAAFERKFRKYKDENENYPPAIEKYLKYLQM